MTDIVLVTRGDREYLLEPGETLETDLGVLELPKEISPGAIVETHLGEPFEVRPVRGPDLFAHLERTGAPMMPRDIGLIIGHTGISAGDSVLDAGTGTGILAAYLGRLSVNVVSYEQNPTFAETARKNMELAGVTANVEVRTGDLCDEIDNLDQSFDLVTLDTGDAPQLVSQAPDLLEAGGYIAVYCPFVETARDCERAAREVTLAKIETYETIQRTMKFDSRGSRPATAGVGHTGYLTFARKIRELNGD